MTKRNDGRRIVKWIVGAAVVGCTAAFVGAWIYFNSIPRENDLRRLIERADAMEIFRFTDDIPVRWVRFEDPDRWEGLAETLHFKERFWRFSKAPVDSIVLQVFIGEQRHLWEVRGDDAIHIRKAVRWYRMPVEPAFENRLRQWLAEHGEDLDPEEQRKRYSDSFTPESS